ncbi:6278_t:CDS:10, partial [Acaulospora morrowiae]
MTSPSILQQKELAETTKALSTLDINKSTQRDNSEQQELQLEPQFKDITSFLDEVTNVEFEIGQLVHLESFGLYDAMSSIEIMDSKMDSGMILDSDLNKKPLDLCARLRPEQTLWIIDRLFICEMTWHSGHSLSQTLFTCMYLHHVMELKPELFSNDSSDGVDRDLVPIEFVILILKSYVLATAKCCQFVLDEMVKGNVYEEEDFATNKYGISIYDDFPESQAIKLLEDADNWLIQHGFHWIRQNGIDKGEEIIRALQVRLLLRKSFLLALVHMSQPCCQQYPQAQRQLTVCMQLLNGTKDEIGINHTLNLGIEVEGAFDPLINRKLVSQTPPRPIRLFTMQESIDEMLNIFQSLSATCRIIDYKSATSLMNYMTYHSSKQPLPCALSRSILQSTVYSENRVLGKISIFQLVKDSVTELTNPPYIYFASKSEVGTSINGSHIDANRAKISKLIHNFVDSAAKPLTDYFRILCHNRSRQRRNMCKVIADWDLLQEGAENIDTELQTLAKEEPLESEEGPSYSFHLSSWVYIRKLTLLEDILFLGFELDLYGNHEFVMMYWYLDYILGVHHRHLERTRLHVADHRKFKRQQTHIQFAPPPSPSVSLIITHQMLTMARQDICRGIHRAIIALQKTGHYVPPKLEFDDENARFSHRFRMYSNLGSPATLTFQDFKETTRLDNITAIDLMNIALQNFQSA